MISLSPWLFNFLAQYIMQNTGINESRAGVKIERRNISNFTHTGEITLMAESEEKLKSLLMEVKEKSKKAALNSTFKNLRSWHLVPSLHANRRGKSGSHDKFYFLGLQNHCGQ